MVVSSLDVKYRYQHKGFLLSYREILKACTYLWMDDGKLRELPVFISKIVVKTPQHGHDK
jgi:hypothetical protein